jgi:hypothetical protein
LARLGDKSLFWKEESLVNHDSVFRDLPGCRLVLRDGGQLGTTPRQLIRTAEDLNTLAVFRATFNDVPFGGDAVSSGSSANIIHIAARTQRDVAFSGDLSASMLDSVWNCCITSAPTVKNYSMTGTWKLTAALGGMNFVATTDKVFLAVSRAWQTTGRSVMNLPNPATLISFSP